MPKSNSPSKSKATYIAVEGPIGVGKSALSERLAQSLGAHLLKEPVEENPFLVKFYQDPAKFAFQTQIFFLMERYQQQKQLTQGDLFRGVTVSDYLFAKDRIFAYLNLDPDELALYNEIYELLDKRLVNPDLVIYLQARPDVLKDRIRRRKRDYERGIRESYLEELNQAYNKFFFQYTASPLLIVNTSDIDFVASTADFNRLLEKIRTVKRGTQHYNPLGSGVMDRDGANTGH